MTILIAERISVRQIANCALFVVLYVSMHIIAICLQRMHVGDPAEPTKFAKAIYLTALLNSVFYAN